MSFSALPPQSPADQAAVPVAMQIVANWLAEGIVHAPDMQPHVQALHSVRATGDRSAFLAQAKSAMWAVSAKGYRVLRLGAYTAVIEELLALCLALAPCCKWLWRSLWPYTIDLARSTSLNADLAYVESSGSVSALPHNHPLVTKWRQSRIPIRIESLSWQQLAYMAWFGRDIHVMWHGGHVNGSGGRLILKGCVPRTIMQITRELFNLPKLCETEAYCISDMAE